MGAACDHAALPSAAYSSALALGRWILLKTWMRNAGASVYSPACPLERCLVKYKWLLTLLSKLVEKCFVLLFWGFFFPLELVHIVVVPPQVEIKLSMFQCLLKREQFYWRSMKF